VLYRTEPSLVKDIEAGKIKTGFQHVSAIAVDSSDRIYVAGDKSIKIFSSGDGILSEIKLTDLPRCLTVAGDGTVYVGMKDRMEVYDSRGTLKSRWGSPGEDAILTSVAVSGNDVFVADAGERVVLRYDSSGRLVSRIGDFVVPSPYFDVAVAPDGSLRVANTGLHRIETYAFDGSLKSYWGEASTDIKGFSGCCNPANFAILSDGRFVTCEKGLPRVKVYSKMGVFESVVAGADLLTKSEGTCEQSDCQTGGFDVAADSQGRILVLDTVEKTVRVFTLLGRMR